MKETLRQHELIEELKKFAPNAPVTMKINGKEYQVVRVAREKTERQLLQHKAVLYGPEKD